MPKLIEFDFNAESADKFIVGHNLPHREDWTIKQFNHGVVVDSFENSFIVTYSPGQGGNSPWSVTLMEIDGGMKQQSGNCRINDLPDAIEAGLRAVTAHWALV